MTIAAQPSTSEMSVSLPADRHGSRILAEAASRARIDIDAFGPGAADALGELLDAAALRWDSAFEDRYHSMLEHYRRNDDARAYTADFLVGAASAAAIVADSDCHAELRLARELLGN